jgi:O-antigen/teichoic acid export membrane protein
MITFLGNLTGTYGMSLLPTLARLPSRSIDQLSLYRTSMAQALALALPVTVGGYLLAPEIIRLVFGESYGPAALPLRILIWTVGIAVAREVARVGLLACGREDRILTMNFWATAVNLLSNVIAIPLLGMVGAAAATVGTEACRLAMAQWFAAGEGLTPSRILRLWRPVAATAVMAAVMLKLDALQLWLIPIGAVVYFAGLVLSGGVRLRWGRSPEFTI